MAGVGACSSTTCLSAVDCPSGEACIGGACVATTLNRCQSSSDCDAGDLCLNGSCQLDCAVHGCPSGEVCDATSHLCTQFVSPLTSGGSTGGSGTTGGNTSGGTGTGTTGGTTGGSSGGTTGGTTGGADAGCTTPDTWNGFAQSFFESNCSCHAVNKPVATRLHFQSYDQVRTYGYLMVFALNYGSMPPAPYGPLDPTDKQRILSWLKCGMPE